MLSKFTEQDTEQYYDNQDEIYSSLWDPEGSVHWGYFDGTTGTDFLQASYRLNQMMIDKGQLTSESKVLDIGCGNGTTAMSLHDHLGCEIQGIDLSGVRIQNAKDTLSKRSPEVQAKVGFEKASATELPYEDGAFTHLWSQACLYHVHEQEQALKEAYRVLQDGGIFIFDDLFKPRPVVSESAQVHVYDRLYFNTVYNFETYQKALETVGFQVLEAHDLSDHLKMSYWCLSTMAYNRGGAHAEHFEELCHAYEQTAQAVINNEVGWGLFLCKK